MTNEEKAIIIAKKNHQIYDDYYDSMQECIESAIQMAKWKDEQFKEQRRIIRKHWQEWAEEQKHKLIDNACEWLKNNIHDYYMTCEFEQWFDDMYEDLKEAMKGGNYDNK